MPEPVMQQRPPSASPKMAKRSSSAKTKGTVRAKSGCYTCRIRRKKCDEKADAEGNCQTCVRLRLQCLGFGAKRPDWMREGNSVGELREKIKGFLASQGMIKGHSGAPTRAAEPDPPMLVLTDHAGGNSPGGTPPHSPHSGSPSSGYLPFTSCERDYSTRRYQYDGYHSPHSPNGHSPTFVQQQLCPDSSTSRVAAQPDVFVGVGTVPPHPNMYTSPALVPNGHGLHPWNGNYAWPQPSATFVPPHQKSNLSCLYQAPCREEDDDATMTDAVVHIGGGANTGSTSAYGGTGYYFPTALVDPTYPGGPETRELFDHYFTRVRPAQFFLADNEVENIIKQLADTNGSVLKAICFVADSHGKALRLQNSLSSSSSSLAPILRFQQRDTTSSAFRFSSAQRDTVTSAHIEEVDYQESTRKALSETSVLTEGEGFAGLLSVSSFLFFGGKGDWEFYLDVACRYVETVLQGTSRMRSTYPYHSHHHHPPTYGMSTAEVLAREPESVRFIVRTTMWFELLASVTQLRPPRFLEVYRELFAYAPGRFQSDDPLMSGALPRSSFGDSSSAATGGLSMMNVMGCDNVDFRAIAEISALAAWKDEELQAGRLSTPELVNRGTEIEKTFLSRTHESVVTGPEDSIVTRRKHTARIFKASARLYLHNVVSGDLPACHEIVEAVQDVVDALKNVPKPLSRPVVRSVVFPICIAGCLTDNPVNREFLKSKLNEERSAGNCAEVLEAMQIVWSKRDRRRPGSIGEMGSWRDVVKRNGILLLV